jgi:hypothetical protein
MNRKVAAVVASLLAAWAVGVFAKPAPKPVPAASTSASQAVPSPAPRLVEQGSYVNSDGDRIHAPAHTTDGTAPGSASAQCRDGSYSFSAHARGTCSHHGGVARWL